MQAPPDVWLFGYGSLVWRPAFDHLERRPAFIEGWARRFWQGSPDHRGWPEDPGRVVTLIAAPAARCHGVAYRVAGAAAAAVIAGLDHRERGGYASLTLPVHFTDPRGEPLGASAEARIYLATADNPHFLGDAPLPAIARQIARCHGPSGANLDYLLRLAEALRELGAVDEHVFDLERLARALVAP